MQSNDFNNVTENTLIPECLTVLYSKSNANTIVTGAQRRNHHIHQDANESSPRQNSAAKRAHDKTEQPQQRATI
jgi:hypothetical protein